jgi:arsenate reductase
MSTSKIVLYAYDKCSTCKSALRFLQERCVPFTQKDIIKTPPTLSELQKMLDYQNGNIKKLFNTSGLLYKEMRLSEKLPALSLDQALALLSQHGMLVKRPFLLGKDFGFVGFNETDWAKNL